MSKWRELFHSQEEIDWFLKLGASKANAEEKKVFFDGVISAKEANPAFNVLEAFPKKPKFENKQSLADRYAGPIIAQLKAANESKRIEEKSFLPKRSPEIEEFGRLFGEVVDRELAKKASAE